MKTYIFLLSGLIVALACCQKDPLPGNTLPPADESVNPVTYDKYSRLLSWKRIPGVATYAVYAVAVGASDNILAGTVADFGSTTSEAQSVNINKLFTAAGLPHGIYKAVIRPAGIPEDGGIYAAWEAEVDFNDEFPPLTGLIYNEKTGILSWDTPLTQPTHLFIYVKKEGAQSYINISTASTVSNRIEIKKYLRGIDHGILNVKITAHNSHLLITGNITQAPSVTIPYPSVTN
ncbi:MAG: hypothetical protein LBI58_05595 [Tannerellaceae bacterium]|jgi:hypothetical protein|nr:hypothetical protein [Tannerellaceae bacterium]